MGWGWVTGRLGDTGGGGGVVGVGEKTCGSCLKG